MRFEEKIKKWLSLKKENPKEANKFYKEKWRYIYNIHRRRADYTK